MHPTIYIPSRLTKLMARWALSLEDVLPMLPNHPDPAYRRGSGGADWSRAWRREPGSHSLCHCP
jgi:hypothetical protein